MPSGAVTVGQLVLSLSADVGSLKTDMASATSTVESSSQKIVNAWAGVSTETDKANAAGARLVAQLKEQITTFGMSETELNQHKANLSGVGAEYQVLSTRLQAMRDAQAVLSGSAAALADAESIATARIRDMVAASSAESVALREAAAASNLSTSAVMGNSAAVRQAVGSYNGWVSNMKSVDAAMKSTVASTSEMSAGTQRLLDKYDPLGTKLRALQSDFALLKKEMGNSIDPATMKAFQGLEDEIAKTKSLMATAGVDGFGKMESGANKSAFATAGATRELIVLGHEAISGNFSRMPGSILVLAERMGGLGAIINPVTLGFLGLGVVAVGMAAAFIKGQAESDKLAKSLTLTGNFAGITEGQFNSMAHAMASAEHIGIGQAREALQTLISTGEFTSVSLKSVADASLAMSRISGRSADDVTADYAKMADGVIKWVESHRQEYLLLSTSEYQHIKELEDHGKAQEAMALTGKLVDDALSKNVENLGYIQQALKDGKLAWSVFWDGALDVGRSDTPEKKIARATEEISRINSGRTGLSRDEIVKRGNELKAAILAAYVEQDAAITKAKEDSDARQTQVDGKIAARELDSIHQKYMSLTDKVAKEHKGYLTYLDNLSISGGKMPSEAMQKHDLSAIDSQGQTNKISDYEKLVKVLNEKLAVEALSVVATDKMTESEKTRAKFLADVAGHVIDVTDKERASILVKLDVIDTIEKSKRSSVDIAKVYADAAAGAQKSIDAAIKEAEANETAAKNWGMTKDQILATELARLQDQYAQRISNGLTIDEVKTLEALIDAKKRSAAAASIVQGNVDNQATLLASDAANKKLADQAIKDWKNVGASISDSLSKGFGDAGKAAGQMFKAFADNAANQLKITKELADAVKLVDGDPTKIKTIDGLHRDAAQAQLKSYADMASAAQGFFDQGSKGYQAMHAAAQVMHAAELALSLVKGVNAVLTQGEGDPYTAFGRMAAMAAVVTGLGVAISGGSSSGGQSAADVQKTQGTGGVFGDLSAKSDSINRSIDLLAKNSNIGLQHTSGMLEALRAIQSSMAGLNNLVVRSIGVTDGSNFGIQTGQINAKGSAVDGISSFSTSLTKALFGPGLGDKISSFINNLWGKTTQTIVDSGLQFGGSVRNLEAGQGYNQYASIDTTKSSFFGLSKSTSNSVQTQGLSNELSAQFGMIFTNLEASLKAAATGIGIGSDQVTKALDALTIDTTKISLKGLTGTALTDALNAVISKTMDTMAQAAFPSFDSFRKVGEGYAETVLRVASDYANLDSILQSTGSTFGAVGVASLAAREHLIDIVGGIDKMASQTKSFSDNFLSEAEKLAPVQKYVSEQLSAMGLASVSTRDQFKQVVLGLDLATDAGARQYAALMNLSDAFAQTHAATVDLTKSEQAIADERKNLQNQYDDITMSATQKLEKARNELDATNRPLFDLIQSATAAQDAIAKAQASAAAAVQAAQAAATASISTARSNLTSAYQRESSALQAVISGKLAEADATRKQIDALKLGALSTLSPEQKYAEAKRQFEAASGPAKTALASTFLDASRSYNASTTAYARDYEAVQKALAETASAADMAAQFASQQLDALKASVTGLIDINNSVLSVRDAIAALGAAQAGGASAGLNASLTGSAGWNGQGVMQSNGVIWDSITGFHVPGTYSDAQAANATKITPHALGGVGSGWSLVGEEGPEIVNFAQPARVYTASQSREMMSGGASTAAVEATKEVALLLRAVLVELQADKEQRGAVGTETIKRLDKVVDKIDGTKRELARQ